MSEVVLQQAKQLFNEGKAQAAWQILRQVSAAPDQLDFFYFLSMVALDCGEHEEARMAVDKCLKIAPHHPGAHFQRALLLLDAGDTSAAIAAFKQATTFAPNWAAAHYNLGVLQVQEGDFVGAEASYKAALKVNPGYALAANNLANIWIDQGQCKQALQLLQRLVHGMPDFVEAWCSLGRALLLDHQLIDALKALEKALALNSASAVAWENVGEVHQKLGDMPAAQVAFDRALTLNPESESLQFKCALLRGESPQRPPDGFVRQLFDGLAREFDTRLVDTLGYRLPFELERHLQGILKKPGSLDVLDLGCGTGLVGVHIKPWTRFLTGVDLSPKMINIAEKRGVYDRLMTASIQDALAQFEDASWDLLIAADVLVYVGNPCSIFDEARRVLKPSGHLLFSIEACADDQDYQLQASGRYAHSEKGLVRLAAQKGFAVEYSAPIPLRKEAGNMLEGRILRLTPV